MLLSSYALPQAPLQVAPYQIITATAGSATACSGCSIYTYAAGTTTPLATYTDYTLGTTLPNPVMTNSAGYAISGGGAVTGIWVTNGACYKIIMKNAAAVTVFTQDHICGPVTSGSSGSFSSLAVSGNATVGGTLGVTGNTMLGGTAAISGNTTVGGTLAVTGNTALGTSTAANLTTTPVTGYVISSIFNCNVSGLSGSAKCFQNSDGSFTIDFHGNLSSGGTVGSAVGLVTPGYLSLGAQTFATWAGCSSFTKGTIVAISDSTVNTWGTAITTGGGSDVVAGFCDGTNYTVFAK